MEKKADASIDEGSVRAAFTNDRKEKPIKRSIIGNNQEVSEYLEWLNKFSNESLQSKLIVK